MIAPTYISTIEELRSYMDTFGDEHLFRGQVEHYILPDGRVSFSSSMGRHGCTPELTRRWSLYAGELLNVISGIECATSVADLGSALLQHYGWRSFYLDVTKDFYVACWFASNRYREKPMLELAVDTFGNEVELVHRAATYEPISTAGHLYVLSRERLKKGGYDVVDLSSIPSASAKRPFCQSGSLVGPLAFHPEQEFLSEESVVAHLVAPQSIYRKITSECGLDVKSLFPDQDDDLFLKFLFAVPWKRIKSRKEMPRFERGLSLPDYHAKKRGKYHRAAFYTPFFVGDTLTYTKKDPAGTANPLFGATCIRAHNSFFFQTIKKNDDFMPNLKAIVEEYHTVVIEGEDLIPCFERRDENMFFKGIIVRRKQELICVSELCVTYQGTILLGVTELLGYHYRWDDSRLQRIASDQDCRCGNEWRHGRLISILAALEQVTGFRLEYHVVENGVDL